MTDKAFYRAVHVFDETEFQQVGRSVHLHGRKYGREFSLAFTGCGTGLHVDLPVSVIPMLIESLQALAADAEERGGVLAGYSDAIRAAEGEGGAR